MYLVVLKTSLALCIISISFLCICMCVACMSVACSWVHSCRGVNVLMHACCRQKLKLVGFYPPYIVRRDSHCIQDSPFFVSLSSQLPPGTSASFELMSQAGYLSTDMNSGDLNSFSHSHGKHCTHWTLSPACWFISKMVWLFFLG